MTSARTLAKRMSISVSVGRYTITGITLSDNKKLAIFDNNMIPMLKSNKEITREALRKHIVKYRPDLLQ